MLGVSDAYISKLVEAYECQEQYSKVQVAVSEMSSAIGNTGGDEPRDNWSRSRKEVERS